MTVKRKQSLIETKCLERAFQHQRRSLSFIASGSSILKNAIGGSTQKSNQPSYSKFSPNKFISPQQVLMILRKYFSSIEISPKKVLLSWNWQLHFTFMSPALRPNLSVNNANESIVPFGSGAGRPISANASRIRAQSNLNILWPAHIRPEHNRPKKKKKEPNFQYKPAYKLAFCRKHPIWAFIFNRFHIFLCYLIQF